MAEGLDLSVSHPLKPAPGVPAEAQALIAAGTMDLYPGATDSLGQTGAGSQLLHNLLHPLGQAWSQPYPLNAS